MRQTYAKKEFIVQTISAVAVSVLTSASVLTVVGFLLGIFSTHGLLSQLGYFLGKVTDMEAVNIFAGGKITDYGDYSDVKMLTPS